MAERQVKLTPIAMVRPSAECIYAPSRLRSSRVMSESEFLERYADGARSVLVSFEPDGVSCPEPMLAYGAGLDCWYLLCEVSDGFSKRDL